MDDLGIYYDPSSPSRLETLIENSVNLTQGARDRAEALVTRLVNSGLSKYNIGSPLDDLDLPKGRRILVPGQVEDDASMGLRAGHVEGAQAFADHILTGVDPIAALAHVDEVWTMTSLLGFEALMHGKRVTCLGTPFYSGWGLTSDRAAPIARRAATPDLIALAHAVLIDYPRYFDPLTGLACPVEVIVERLENNEVPTPGAFNRSLAKLQGVFASYAHLWR